MLKIEKVKWLGKCKRHPMFDPEAGGIGAIKGGCPRCLELQAIFVSNQHTLQLMRAFAPIPEQRGNPADPDPDRQQDLFASLPPQRAAKPDSQVPSNTRQNEPFCRVWSTPMSPGGIVAIRKIPTVLQGRVAWKHGLATVDVIAPSKSADPCRT
jgi:phage FluMu protein Com